MEITFYSVVSKFPRKLADIQVLLDHFCYLLPNAHQQVNCPNKGNLPKQIRPPSPLTSMTHIRWIRLRSGIAVALAKKIKSL